jgi:hypothetical protein
MEERIGKFAAHRGPELRRAFRRPQLIEPGHQGISQRRRNGNLRCRAAGRRIAGVAL